MHANKQSNSLTSLRQREPEATMTPIRVQAPRMTRKRAATPQRLCTSFTTPDRFIPNRKRMDTSLVKAALLHAMHGAPTSTVTFRNSEKTTQKTSNKNHYERQLRKAPFGRSEECVQLMNFGYAIQPHLY